MSVNLGVIMRKFTDEWFDELIEKNKRAFEEALKEYREKLFNTKENSNG